MRLNLKKFKNRSLFFPTLLVIINVVVYHRWLTLSVFQHSDWLFFWSQKLKELLYPTIWVSDNSLGYFDFAFWKTPTYVLFSFFGFLDFNSNVSDFFVFFFPIIFILPLGAYYLVKHITSSKIGAFVGSIVISFNSFFLSIATQGHIAITVSSAYCILSILYYIKALESNKTIKYYILSAIYLFFSTFYDFRITYITLFILFFYFVYASFFIINIRKENIFKLIFYNTIFISLFLLFNAYWILPHIFSGELINNEILERSLFGNNFWSIENALTLFHPFWTGKSIEWFTIQTIPLYFWFIPFFAYLGLYITNKNKYILFFGFISLLGIFLSKQIDIPFGRIYEWLFNNFPGFNAFREASKFYFLILLGYGVLIGNFVGWIDKENSDHKLIKSKKYILIIIICSLFLINTIPILTGKIDALFVPRAIPNDYTILKEFISEQDDYFRTFWIPRDSRWTYYTNKNPKLADAFITVNEWEPLVDIPNTIEFVTKGRMLDILMKSFSDNLFDQTNIKYVIVPIYDYENNDNLFIHYGGRNNPDIRNTYITQIDKIKWLQNIDIGTEELTIYENPDYKPRIYTTKNKELLSINQPIKQVSWKSINPSYYTIHINRVNGPFYLNFTDNYHTEWKAMIDKLNLKKALFTDKYFLDDQIHTRTEANLNSFYINTKEICKNYNCKLESDGSYSFTLSLFYKPQAYFYLGTLVSLSSLIISLVIILKKRRS